MVGRKEGRRDKSEASPGCCTPVLWSLLSVDFETLFGQEGEVLKGSVLGSSAAAIEREGLFPKLCLRERVRSERIGAGQLLCNFHAKKRLVFEALFEREGEVRKGSALSGSFAAAEQRCHEEIVGGRHRDHTMRRARAHTQS